MQKHIIALALGIISITNTTTAQQWNGDTNATNPINRAGFVKIGGNPLVPLSPNVQLDVDASFAPENIFDPNARYAARILNNKTFGAGLLVQSSTLGIQTPVFSVATQPTNAGNGVVPLATFYANGKIGFGTIFSGGTMPEDFDGYRLYVRDGIRTERLKLDIATAKGWADYVFEDTYRLLPLSELQRYIAQHKHLPDVPSAKELAEKGLEVGEMQKIQMQKIEELTLYLLEQKKEIDALKKRINELENNQK
jgi:hypothetical protein